MKTFSKIVTLLITSYLLLSTGCAASSAADENLTPQQAQGKRVYRDNCAACHANSGETVIVGPSLAGVATRAAQRLEGYSAQDYIKESIMKPGSYIVDGFADLMPTEFGLTLTGEEFDALLAYLLTLE